MSSFEIECHSEVETQRLGTRLAEALTSGLTIALNGQLGSGKTCLVRAVCSALGVAEDDVNSPTFVLLQAYSGGRLDVVHFDTYRLADVDEFLAIGGEDYLLDPDTVCFVEWADRIHEVLPADHLTINITQTSATARRFHCFAHGPNSENVLTQIHGSRPAT